LAKRDSNDEPFVSAAPAWPRADGEADRALPLVEDGRPGLHPPARLSRPARPARPAAAGLPARPGPPLPAAAEGADSTAQIAARRAALVALTEDAVPFVVAGAYAMREYTGIHRDTKDLDIFCRRADVAHALRSLTRVGFRVELTDSLWLAKGFADDGEFVDVIFSSGNGVAEVDDQWLARARRARVLGVMVRVAPPEEVIWSKSYVQERERYDGADIHHLLRHCAGRLDWRHLLDRMRPHAEVLLAHLLLFRFAFPVERDKVPAWVLDELTALCRRPALASERRLCRGTLLSGRQYQVDLQAGLRDARPLEVPRWSEHRDGHPKG